MRQEIRKYFPNLQKKIEHGVPKLEITEPNVKPGQVIRLLIKEMNGLVRQENRSPESVSRSHKSHFKITHCFLWQTCYAGTRGKAYDMICLCVIIISHDFIKAHMENFVVVIVQLLCHFWLLRTTWTAAHQASLSFTISWSLLELMSIELVMPFNHLILCHPLLLLPSIMPSIRILSNESALHIM